MSHYCDALDEARAAVMTIGSGPERFGRAGATDLMGRAEHPHQILLGLLREAFIVVDVATRRFVISNVAADPSSDDGVTSEIAASGHADPVVAAVADPDAEPTGGLALAVGTIDMPREEPGLGADLQELVVDAAAGSNPA